MKQVDKDKAISIIALGVARIVSNYTNNALLINSCFIAANRYRTISVTTGLSTNSNIPPELRLDNEIDVQFTNKDLVRKYESDIQKVVFQNYIITSVSIVDATLEDLYEHFLKADTPSINDTELEKQIRNAWTNDNMFSFLTNGANTNLKRPSNKQMEFEEVFMRYYELRIVRHTLLHTNGKLSDKNYQKLQDNLSKTPVERRQFALANAPLFDDNREIVFSVNHILSIRQYLHRFLMYMLQSIDEVTVNKQF